MLGFLVFGTIFTLLILGGGAFMWRRADQAPASEEGQRRTRGEARQVQGHFEADADYARNFQRPTQNEVLETLQMLDHLSPGWDQGEAELLDRRLKNELAESFPNLLKAGCVYPQTIEEDIPRLFGTAPLSPQALDTRLRSHRAKLARARQEFRAERAHANALHQLTSSVEASPVALAPGSLPFRVSEEKRSNRGAQVVRWAAVTVAVLALALGGWYLAANPQGWNRVTGRLGTSAEANPSVAVPTPAVVAVVTTLPPTPTPTALLSTPEGPVASGTAPAPSPGNSPANPSAVLAEATTPSPAATPAAAATSATEASLAARIAESQQRAVDKYPDLAVPNSEINIRFVFRYKSLLSDKSPRLQDPEWPEKLAAECARAVGGAGKKPRKP